MRDAQDFDDVEDIADQLRTLAVALAKVGQRHPAATCEDGAAAIEQLRADLRDLQFGIDRRPRRRPDLLQEVLELTGLQGIFATPVTSAKRESRSLRRGQRQAPAVQRRIEPSR